MWEFDHHCPVVGNCVAGNNRREFVLYLASLFAAEALMLGQGTVYLRLLAMRALDLHALPSFWAALGHAGLLIRLRPGTLYMLVVVAGVTAGTVALLVRAAWGIAACLTTNEMILRARYSYLSGPDGAYR